MKLNRIMINAISFLLCSLSLFSSASQTEEAIKADTFPALSKCQLKVGWTYWPPYQYLSDSGEPIGLQIELLNQIASEANCTFNYVAQSFTQNVKDIENGRIDMMGDATVTAERQVFSIFSETYRHEIQILYIRDNFPINCKDKSLSQILSGDFRLGVSKVNLYGDNVKTILADSKFKKNIVYLDQNNQGLQAIMDRKIDGYFEDPAVIAYLLATKHWSSKIKSCVVENYAGDVSLMFSKKSVKQGIVNRINKALSKIKQTIEYKKNWEL